MWTSEYISSHAFQIFESYNSDLKIIETYFDLLWLWKNSKRVHFPGLYYKIFVVWSYKYAVKLPYTSEIKLGMHNVTCISLFTYVEWKKATFQHQEKAFCHWKILLFPLYCKKSSMWLQKIKFSKIEDLIQKTKHMLTLGFVWSLPPKNLVVVA